MSYTPETVINAAITAIVNTSIILDRAPLLWIKADSQVAYNNSTKQVSKVVDNSPYGWTGVQGTSGQQPTRQLDSNGLAYLNFDAANHQEIDFPYSIRSGSACTLYIVINPTDNGGLHQFIFSHNDVSGNFEYSLSLQANGGLLLYCGSSFNSASIQIVVTGLTVVCIVITGTTIKAYNNGFKIDEVSFSPTPATNTGTFKVGGWNPIAATYYSATMKLYNLVLFATAHTDSIRNNICKSLYARYQVALRGIYFDGNSLTLGNGSTSGLTYPKQTLDLLGKTFVGSNLGVSGQTTTQMTADRDTQILSNFSEWSRSIVIAWELTNEIAGGSLSATQIYNNMVSYCQGLIDRGFKVICLTCLPRSSGGNEALRQNAANKYDATTVNGKIRNDFTSVNGTNPLIRLPNASTTWATLVADIGDDATIGQAGAQTNATYYDSDQVHLANAGYAIVAALVRDTILLLD